MPNVLLKGKRKKNQGYLNKNHFLIIALKDCVVGIFVVYKSFSKREKKREEHLNAALSVSCHGVHFSASSIMQIGVLLK